MRLTTDAPIDYILSRTTFNLHERMHFVLDPDETLTNSVSGFARSDSDHTEFYCRGWVHRLAIPFEWQEAVF